MNSKLEKAYFGGGCFWCTEAIYQQVKGVEAVVSGYAGGVQPNPNYTQVSNEETGHAEVIEVTFDPTQVSYEQLLDIFFHTHNPTTLNQQGADIGTQYRSIILYTSEEQKQLAEKTKTQLQESGEFEHSIVTDIQKFEVFYSAEEYHQNYYQQNRGTGYCELVITPKVDAFQRRYQALLKK